jgi:ribosomal protein L6P/L9E
LVLKLGYSHYVIYLLPYELSIAFIGRKRRSFMLSCSNQKIVSLVSRYIACLRIPNVYTGKGIRLRGTLFLRKEGKRSQF